MKFSCKIVSSQGLVSLGLIVFFLMALAFPFYNANAEVSGELVKVDGDSSVYLVKDGVRHVFPHEAIYLSWGYPDDYSTVVTILEDNMNAYENGDPVPFRTGYMFRGTSSSLHGKEASAVFIADGNKIRPIYSGEVYQTLFNDPDWRLVGWIPDDFLSKFSFELGETVLTDNAHPNGTLIEYNEYPGVRYLIENNERRIISNEAFISNGFDEGRVIKQAYSKYNYSNGKNIGVLEETWAEPSFVLTAPVDPVPEPDPIPEPVDATVYTSYSQKHISNIEYPEDWTRSTYFNAINNRHEIYFENSAADGAFGSTFTASVVVVFEGNVNIPSTMEDYKKVLNRISFLDNIVYNDLSIENQEDAVVNDLGLTEKNIEFKVEKNSRNIKQKVYDLISDTEEIYVVMSALDSTWDNYSMIFEHIYSSFILNKDKGFSDRNDLEVTGWGFTDASNVEVGGTAIPYVDIKNSGDTAINLANTVKCKLTLTLPTSLGGTILTQEPYITNGDSFLPGETTRVEFNGIILNATGEYNFAILANSNSYFEETTLDNNYNDVAGRKVVIE